MSANPGVARDRKLLAYEREANRRVFESRESIPESDAPEAIPRFNHLAHTLQDEGEPEPIFEQLTTKLGENV